eukprot:g10539.t1
MSNPLRVDLSSSGLDVSGSSSVVFEGVVPGKNGGLGDVGDRDVGEQEEEDESSDSDVSLGEAKAGGTAKSGGKKSQARACENGVDPFTIRRPMGRMGEWECVYRAIGKQDLAMDYRRNCAPVDRAKLSATIETGWNRDKNKFFKKEKAAEKLTGEGTMTQEEESEMHAKDSETYYLIMSIKYQHAAKEQAKAADAVAKKHAPQGQRCLSQAFVKIFGTLSSPRRGRFLWSRGKSRICRRRLRHIKAEKSRG